MTQNKQNNKVEEIGKEFLRTCVNINGLSLGDMVLHNGEVLKDIPEFTEALSEALTSSYEQGVRDERGTKIYLDTEFNGKGGALISIALVSEDGKEFYEALDTPPNLDPWVEENVIPKLNKKHIQTLPVLRESLGYFLSNFDNPVIIADHPADLQYLNWLMSEYVAVREHTVPFTYTTKCVADVKVGVASKLPHNALEDARALMQTLQALKNN